MAARLCQRSCHAATKAERGVVEVLGGAGDLVIGVISTLIGVITKYKSSYLIYNPSY